MNNHGMLLVWRTKAMLLLVFVTLLAAGKASKVGFSLADCFSFIQTRQFFHGFHGAAAQSPFIKIVDGS
jgi:hypothetical protein